MWSFLTLLTDLSFPIMGNLIKKFWNLSNPHPLPAPPSPPHGVYIDRCITVPDPDFEIIGGVQVLQTLRWGRGEPVSKKSFSAFRVSVWSKTKGWPAPPGSLPWIRHWITLRDWPCTLSAAELFIRSLDHLASLNKLGGSARRVRWTIRNVMGVGKGKYKINMQGGNKLKNKKKC